MITRDELAPWVPYRVRRRLSLVRRARLWRDAGVVFIHIPKAAGTSISRELYGRALGHYSYRELDRWASRTLEACIVFTVVRNPYARAVSAYTFARLGQTDTMGMQHPSRYAGPDLDSFESFACDWLPHQDRGHLDNVFLPQTHFTMGGRFDHVGRVEQLGVTASFLERRLGRQIRFERLNATSDVMGEPVASTLVTPRAKRAIREFYAADFDAFGYD